MRTCGNCGAKLTGAGPAGLCPKCFLQEGLTPAAADFPPAPGANRPPAFSPQHAQVQPFGDYELLQEIAHGGMGVVYKARQASLHRLVALKMILPGHLASDEAVKRFRVEAEAAAGLDHPNIVSIYEVGQHEGQHYYSMQFVEGPSLAQHLARRSEGFSPREAARLLVSVARAVHHAHQRGILHRDLKPANILIDAYGQPHVTDFGLARLIEGGSDLTLSGTALGTPSYMSPEQATGKVSRLTTATDIYSLGAVLYFLLTGHPPFEAATPLEVMRKVADEEPVPPSRFASRLQPARLRTEPQAAVAAPARPAVGGPPGKIDRDLETICLKCLEKDPARRYASADALADDLEHWLRDEPIRARPISRREHVAKWVKRNPALAGWALAAVLVAMIGVAGIAWQWRRADLNAAREMRQRERVEGTVVRLEMEQADSLFGQDRAGEAVAQLARLLRRHPDNQVVAERLLSALSARDSSLPPTASPTNLTTIDGGRIRRYQPLALAFVHRVSGPRGIYWAEFSPDGQRVVTASADSTARVWETRTGRPVTPPLCHHAAIRVARFSPDGQLVATASDDASARVWGAGTGQPLTPPLEHGDRVLEVRFSPDGRWLVTASADGTARVWEARTGRPLGRPLQCGKAPVPSLEDEAFAAEFGESAAAEFSDGFTANFSPDGRRVVTTCPDGGIRLWDPVTGQMIGRPLAYAGSVPHLRFSRDGSRLVILSANGTARVWDARTGQTLTEPVPQLERVPNDSLGFSPRGSKVVTLSGNTAQIWDLRTGQPVGNPMVRTNRLLAAQFSPDGTRLVLTSVGGTVCLWDVQAAVRLSGPLPQGGEVRRTEFSPDGQWLLTASSDGQARLWELPAAPAPVPRWLPDLAEAVVGQRLSENGGRETVSPERLLKLKQQLANGAGTDFYARWAKWFFAPGATRTLSPSCSITVPQYVEGWIEEGTLESLREAVSLAPTNAVALARLGLATLAQSETENPRRIEESEGLLHQAMELAPHEPKVLRARVEWLDRMGQPAEALALVEEGLQTHADSPELWQAKGELLEQTNRLEDANQAFTQALKLADTETPLRALRQAVLQQRADLRQRLKRPADALADYRNLLALAYPTARECYDKAWLNLFGPRAQRDPPERTLLFAEKAMRLDPKDWRNFRLLGMARYRAGQFTAATEAFQAEGHLRHRRLSPQTLLYLALTHHRLGQTNQARTYLRQAEKWWKTTFERLDRSCENRGPTEAAETAARRRRYGETAWMVQIGQITQLEDVYARLGLPAQAQLWALRSEAERVLGMPMYKHKWKVVSVSFEVPWIVGRAAGAIDENPVTIWHTCPPEGEHHLPQEIIVDLGETLELTAFTYLPRPDESPNGIVDQYEFYLSTDGKDWKEPVAKGTFTNLKADRSLRTVPFARPVTARYFRFVGLHAVAANHLALAELAVVEK